MTADDTPDEFEFESRRRAVAGTFPPRSVASIVDTRSTVAVAAVGLLALAGATILLWTLGVSSVSTPLPFLVVAVSAVLFALTGWVAFRR